MKKMFENKKNNRVPKTVLGVVFITIIAVIAVVVATVSTWHSVAISVGAILLIVFISIAVIRWEMKENLQGALEAQRIEAEKQAMFADIFMSSTNAITEDGVLINIDGKGNRVAGLIFGPSKIIVVAGKNKIAANEAAAMERIKAVACPLNGKRLKKQLPCVLTGKCNDCRSADRMCRVTVKHETPTRNKEFHIIIVGEELGY